MMRVFDRLAGVMINRGFRKVSPDDGLSGLVGGRRLTGKSYRQGKYAPRRNWGSGADVASDGQVSGPVKALKLVPWKKPSGLPSNERKASTLRAGRVLGWIAMGSLVQLWMVVILDVLARIIGGGVSDWSEWFWPSALVALVGTQLLGFLSDNLTGSQSEWGTRAMIGFWFSVLMWVPIGFFLAMVSGLFA
ncbi:hypothetical protein [Haloferula sp.]|uniref:hypothetical protein n=1 Tax=Haloferula sp. TaxID=2497595 RepID=UPI003C72DDF8